MTVDDEIRQAYRDFNWTYFCPYYKCYADGVEPPRTQLTDPELIEMDFKCDGEWHTMYKAEKGYSYKLGFAKRCPARVEIERKVSEIKKRRG